METMSLARLMNWCRSHTVEVERQAANGDKLAKKLIDTWNQYDGAGNALTEAALRGAVIAYRTAHPTVEMEALPRAVTQARAEAAELARTMRDEMEG